MGELVNTCRAPEGPEDYCGSLASVCVVASEQGRCPEHAPEVQDPWGGIWQPDYSTWTPGELMEAFGK